MLFRKINVLKFFFASLLFLVAATFFINSPVFSDTASDLQKQIAEYEQKLVELRGQKQTLSSQIGIMDSQIRLTELRVNSTNQKIKELQNDIEIAKNKVGTLQENIDDTSTALLGRISAVYEIGRIDPWQMFLTSGNITNFLNRLKYLRIVQAYDKKTIYAAEQAKKDYNNQKEIYEDKQVEEEALKKQLTAYTLQLNSEKASKQQLLAQTQGSEAKYQSLLSQAKTQLSALSSFAKSVTGGVSIIPHQELSDSWGAYYNQRDANWGNNLIGSSSENISSVGCLLTSYAMVVTHFGGSITPPEVAANTGNFWYSTALFLKPGPAANGRTATSTSYNPSLQDLRDALNSGKAVIAGLSYDGGSIADHWLVLRSVDGDSFRVNDPLYAGAMNVSLNDRYSGLRIVEARIYQ